MERPRYVLSLSLFVQSEYLCIGVANRKLAIVKLGRQNFLRFNLKPSGGVRASQCIMNITPCEIFDEEYRVLAVESQSLTIQGVRSGQVLTIVTQNPEAPLTPAEYPPGQLIALSDPWRRPVS